MLSKLQVGEVSCLKWSNDLGQPLCLVQSGVSPCISLGFPTKGSRGFKRKSKNPTPFGFTKPHPKKGRPGFGICTRVGAERESSRGLAEGETEADCGPRKMGGGPPGVPQELSKLGDMKMSKGEVQPEMGERASI